jgi:hypothetical protein
MRAATLLVAVLGAASVLLLAPAAGAAPELDSKKLAKQVSATVAPSYPDLPVTTSACPKKIPRKVGTAVICDVTAGGLSLQFKVTQTDKKGNVTIESTQAVIPKLKAEELVKNNATLPVAVDCGADGYIVRPPGFPFSCTARFNDGTVQQVTLSPTDVAGNATITQVS